ncbi:methyl-accepting chemotaxis protein [Marinomonas pollencensis]|uniref:Methyl-accepting chemotaxis sensory transducer with Cache sensor n=1 Tax=Marinomonas pollencensis TaxID=491954 RepID=A0A3E0DRG2_9GAMM|nr:methyl-accepting chemotaxis protein [Marinomonas pollencensis]REG85737.1 methyl-accepting chemotaxis sensory transducer with Cache sensor [Marinomonas pollencensis]
MTLQRKFSLVVFTSAIVVAIIVGSFGYFKLKDSLVNSLNAQVSSIAEGQSRTISEWVHAKTASIHSLSHHFIEHDVTVGALLQAEKSGDFDLAYIGTKEGEMILSHQASLPADYDPRIRPWYKKALSSNQVEYTEPYIDASTNQLIISAAEKVVSGSGVTGVVGADMNLSGLVKGILHVNMMAKSRVFLTNKEGVIIAHPDQQFLLKKMNASLGYDMDLVANAQGKLVETHSKEGVVLVAGIAVPDTDWVIFFQLDKATAMSPLTSLLISLLIAMVIAALLVSFVMGLVSRKLLAGIGQVNTMLAEMNNGQGDLTTRIPETSQDEIGDLARHFNGFLQTLAGIITEIKVLSSSLNNLAQDSHRLTSQSSLELSTQLDEITAVATAVGQMSAATHEIASNAENTANASREAYQNSQQGSDQVVKSKDSISDLASQVTDASNIIGNLDHQVQSISSILTTIQNIAEQTNLLALNAAIEAARAGEHGRGFAVVADEVRVLSQRTHNSTEEIKEMIDGLNSTTQKAVDIMHSGQAVANNSVEDAIAAAESLVAIQNSVQRISDMSLQIASAAEEQNIVTSDISNNSLSIKDIANKLAVESHESAKGAESLAELAQRLEQQIARFRV